MGGFLVEIRLVVSNPQDLGGGEPGERVIAGDRDESFPAQSLSNLLTFGAGPLVVPQDRGTEDLIVGIQ